MARDNRLLPKPPPDPNRRRWPPPPKIKYLTEREADRLFGPSLRTRNRDVMDLAADETGLDPAELRRRNLISPDAFPYRTAIGTEYDTGEYAKALDEALRIAGYPDLLAEQAARRERGDVRQLGVGLALYVEVTGGGGGDVTTGASTSTWSVVAVPTISARLPFTVSRRS